MSSEVSGRTAGQVEYYAIKRPALYILIPFCVGIFVSTFGYFSVFYSILLSVLCVLVSFLLSTRLALRAGSASASAALYLGLFFLGAAYYQNSDTIPPDNICRLASEAGQRVCVRGEIVDDPAVGKTVYGTWASDFLVKVNAARRPGDQGVFRGASGLVNVRVYTKAKRGFNFGDTVVLEGGLSRPAGLKNPGLFDYSKYLAMKNIYAILSVSNRDFIQVVDSNDANFFKRLAFRARGALRRTLDMYLTEQPRYFAKAMLIGDRSGLRNDITDDFIKTGTVHTLAISGLQVALIAALVLGLFSILGIPRKISLIMTMVFISFYLYIAGASPPIVRSVIMFAILALGYLIDRDVDGLNTLALAAFLILLWNPKELFDPAFQLSFGSIAGIMIFTPRIDELLRLNVTIERSGAFRTKAVRYLVMAVSVSLAAWLATWPIVSFYFNIVSPISILANLAIVPMTSISMGISLILLCAGVISSSLAHLAAFALGVFDEILFHITHLFALIPFGSLRIARPSALEIAAYYLLIFAWIGPGVMTFYKLRIRRMAVVITALVALNAAVWARCLDGVEGRMAVTFLDVGQGDSAYIELPGGATMLIDAGSGGDDMRFDAGRSVVAPFLWNKGLDRIDVVIISHMHEDHLGGALYLLNNFKVGVVIDSGVIERTKLYDEYLRLVREKGLRRVSVGADDAICFVPDAYDYRMCIVSPGRESSSPNENANSIVGKLSYAGRSILFCGDTTSDAMAPALSRYGDFLKSDILKVPHHGGIAGDPAVVKKFFNVVSPRASIVSTGASKRYDKRKKSCAAFLDSVIYQTVSSGAVTLLIYTDGRMEIKGEN